MSADAPPPPAPESTPPSPDTIDPLPHKRRYKKPGSEDDEPGSTDEIILLSSLLKSLLKKDQDPVAKAEPKSNSKINRFVVKNAPATPASERAGDEPVVGAENTAGPEAPAPPVLPKLKPRHFRAEGDDRYGVPVGKGARSILYFAFTAAVAIAAFLIGRSDARRTAPKPPAAPPAVWTAVPISRLDQALAADQAGDLAGAKQLATDLKKLVKASPAVDLYLQSLETRLGETNNVEAALSRALPPDPSSTVAEPINRGLAFNYARARDFPHALETFAAITEADPLTASNFYYWGETLRRSGRMPDAIEKFRQTLLRLPSDLPELDSQRQCAELKLRLCLIEMGREAEIRPAIDEQLRAPVPSGHWLLTAAAAALQRGEFPAALEELRRARAALSPALYAGLTDDYFFHAYSYRSELAEVLPPADPLKLKKRQERTAYFVDP